MKTKSSLLFILLAAFFLTSCGAKKTVATLEVSTSALSVNNTSYAGGLVIMGSSKSGSFTIPIAGGSGSGNSITLDLPRDTWTFSAIGWEGATPFKGNSKCGSQTVDLNNDEQTVSLNIDYAKCGAPGAVFGSNAYRSGNSFIDLTIVTCGWLYEDNVMTPVGPLTATNFCDAGSSIDAKYKNWAKSASIEVLQNIDGVTSSVIPPQCISGSAGLIPTNFTLPEKGVPFVITLYKEPSCQDGTLISKFNFSDGLGAVYSDHDSVFNKLVSEVRLFLPSYDTKRGYSSLLAQKAKPLQCNFMPCMSIPTAIPGGKDRIIRSGSEFVVTAIPGLNQTCAKLNGFSAPNINTLTLLDLQSKCEMKDGQMIISFNYSSFSANPSLTLMFNGGANITVSVAEDPSYESHEFAWEMLGYPLNPSPSFDVANSFRAFFDYPEDTGLLSQVREMMGPEGAGGILGPGMTCSGGTAIKFVTFIEDGVNKTYKVELMNADVTPVVSAYIFDGSNAVGTAFDKKILISLQLAPGSFRPEMALHFNCGYSIGRFQNWHIKNGKVEKRLIEWNTEVAANARVREIKYEEESDATRTTKISASYRFAEAPDTFQIYTRSWDLNISWNGSAYDFYSGSKQVNVINSDTGFRYVNASPTFSSNALITDVAYIANLTTAVTTPSFSCVSKSAFGPGTCTTPTTFSNQAYGTPFTPANLTPANIQSYFSAL